MRRFILKLLKGELLVFSWQCIPLILKLVSSLSLLKCVLGHWNIAKNQPGIYCMVIFSTLKNMPVRRDNGHNIKCALKKQAAVDGAECRSPKICNKISNPCGTSMCQVHWAAQKNRILDSFWIEVCDNFCV